jgi:hypothetical protein
MFQPETYLVYLIICWWSNLKPTLFISSYVDGPAWSLLCLSHHLLMIQPENYFVYLITCWWSSLKPTFFISSQVGMIYDIPLKELRMFTDYGRTSRPLFIVDNQRMLIRKVTSCILMKALNLQHDRLLPYYWRFKSLHYWAHQHCIVTHYTAFLFNAVGAHH